MTFDRGIHLNEEVLVKLTPAGLDILHRLPYADLQRMKLQQRIIRIQLWEFMRIFGQYLNPNGERIVVNNEVLLRESSLKPIDFLPEMDEAGLVQKEIGEVTYPRRRNPKLNLKMNTQKAKAIYQLDMNSIILDEFDSIKAAALAMTTSTTNIHRALTREYKTAAGYRWRYKEEYDKEQQDKINQHGRETNN